jgi:predicted ATPase
MKFTHVSLENWRNFGRVEIKLQDRVFLVGPNASGKSNFLDVFRFLRDLVTPGGGFEKAIADRGGVSSIRNLAARRYSDIVIEVAMEEDDVPGWHYRLAFTQDNQRRPVLKAEQVWRDSERLLDRPDDADRQDPERLRQTYLEQTFANREFRDIADFFATIHYYHLVPQLVREPDRYVNPQSDPYGGDFLARIAGSPARTRQARLRHIQKALQVAVPQLSELKLDKDDQGIPHLYGNYEHWRPKGAWQTEADFSDGTLRLLGLLWTILDGSGPLLLEEPELSLHPEIVRYIPQMIYRIQRARKRKRRQILLSTHSSDLLRDEGIAADEVLLFKPSMAGSEVKAGAEIAEIRALLEAGLPAADAVLPHTRPMNARQLTLFAEDTE